MGYHIVQEMQPTVLGVLTPLESRKQMSVFSETYSEVCRNEVTGDGSEMGLQMLQKKIKIVKKDSKTNVARTLSLLKSGNEHIMMDK